MPDKAKGFVEGFTPYLRLGAELIAKNISRNAYLKQQEEAEKKKQEEEERKRQEQQARVREVFKKVLQGGDYQLMGAETIAPSSDKTQGLFGTRKKTAMEKAGNQYQTERTGQEFFRPLSTLDQIMLKAELPSNYRSAIDEYRKLNEQPEYELKYDQPYIYKENKQTKERVETETPNPYYVKKPTHYTTDYLSTGEKVIRDFYEDGSYKDTMTGFYKDEKGNEKFNPKTFEKTLTGFYEKLVKLNKLKVDLQDPYLPEEHRQGLQFSINQLNEAYQSSLYNLMDDETKKYIDLWYDELKQEAEKYGVTLQEAERTLQSQLRERFISTIAQDFNGTSEDYQRKRAAILYVKFKYGYIYDKKDSTNRVPKIAELPPQIGDIEDGYRFKGGDPGNPENWEKVE